MRFLIALLAMLLFLALLGAQEKLVLKGDVKEVEVERTVVVKDRVKVATLPVTITAPSGATDYRWKYPPSVTATDDDGEVLDITDAPNGPLTVSVRMKTYTIKDGALVVAAKTLQITFTVGEVFPPGPSPTNPFGEAWKLETNSKRASYAAVVAALYRGYAKEAKDGSKTGRQLFDFMSAAYLAAETGGEKIQGKLPKLIPVVNQWIADNLKIPEGQLSVAERIAAEAAFIKVAEWLGELK